MNNDLQTQKSEKSIISKFYMYTIIIGSFVLISFFTGTYITFSEFKQNYLKDLKKELLNNQKNYTKQNLDQLIKRIQLAINQNPTKQEDIKKDFLKRINNLRFPNNGYVWIHNSNHQLILNPYRPNDIKKDDKELVDSKGTKIIQLFIQEATKNPNGTFVEYYWKKPNNSTFKKKLSYLIYFKQWDWVIGTGIYFEDLNSHIQTYKKNYELKVADLKNRMMLLFLITSILMIFFALSLSKDIKNKFSIYSNLLKKYNKNLENEVSKKTKKLKKLNKYLQKRVSSQLEKNRLQEMQILEQSKHAQMGEMIENIAHQWRQPLNVISTRASYIKLQNQFDKLNKDDVDQTITSIINTTQHLSKTINTFKNFIHKKNEKVSLEIAEVINEVSELLIGTLNHHNIDLIKEYKNKEPIKMVQFEGELSQVIINILNNAKDALNEHNTTTTKWVQIDIQKDSKNVIITIEDNAGGIPKDILHKIFDPYFTTKHKSQGTGLGLYMSYKIIKEHFNGELSIKNTQNGAKFFIKLPIK